MAVLHLSTGHVVGALAVDDRVPTVADATGAAHVAVRIPGGEVVRVPAEMLTALPVPANSDVLTRPTHYQLSNAAPPLAWTGSPGTRVAVPTKAGREALSIWDGGAEPEIARETLDDLGVPPARTPPGATHRLFAVEGEPLMYEP